VGSASAQKAKKDPNKKNISPLPHLFTHFPRLQVASFLLSLDPYDEFRSSNAYGSTGGLKTCRLRCELGDESRKIGCRSSHHPENNREFFLTWSKHKLVNDQGALGPNDN
jgi:hypothetical protein